MRLLLLTESAGLFEPLVGKLLPWLYQESVWWTCFGVLGNIMFSSRFVIQWLYSEKLKRVVVPPIFWHQSFWGSLITAIYALHVDKLPFIIGSFFLPFIYARNLWLLKNGGTPNKTPAKKEVIDQAVADLQPQQ